MSEIPKIVPSLTGGVSQQPPGLRFPGQVTEAENTMLSLVDGATKRPPTAHEATLITGIPDNAAYHVIERDGEDYIVVLSDTPPSGESVGIRVFDMDGTELTVIGSNSDYAIVEDSAYAGNAPNNYLSDWENPGLAGQWFTEDATDEMVSTASAEVGPLGTGTAVLLGPLSAEPGILTQYVSTYFGKRTTCVSIYAKKNDGLDSFALSIRDTTKLTSYAMRFQWNGNDLELHPTYADASGTGSVENVPGTDWWRATYILDSEDAPLDTTEGPREGYKIQFVQILTKGTGGDQDYFWGAALHFDDDALLTQAPDIEQAFGPFKFLTIADTELILNTAWKTRVIAPAIESRSQWMTGLKDEVKSVITIDINLYKLSTAYTWALENGTSGPQGTTVTSGYQEQRNDSDGGTYNVIIGHDSREDIAADIASDIQASHSSFSATAEGSRITVVSHSEVSAATVTPIIMAVNTETVEDTLLIEIQTVNNSTDYDYSITNTEGTHTGTYASDGTATETEIRDQLLALIVAHESLSTSTAAGSTITVKSYTEITDHWVTPDILLSYGGYAVDVMYLFVQQGVSLTPYTWELTNGEGTFTGTTTTLAGATDTVAIAEEIKGAVISADASLDTSVRLGSVVEIRSTSPITSLSVEDGGGDNLLGGFQHEVRAMTDLPVYFRDGYTIRVSSDPTTEIEDLYVTFSTEEDEPVGKGTWIESPDWAKASFFDPASMPRQLTLVEDDDAGTVTGTAYEKYFTFLGVDWIARGAGNTITNKPPSFANRTIAAMMFYANRLGFVSDQNLVMSEAGVYFNMWATTTIAVPDSDRIDIAVNEAKLATLQSSAELDEQLVLSSSQAQFVLSGSPITPSTALLVRIAGFRVSDVEPVSSGKSLIFPTFGAEYAAAMDFFRTAEGAFTAEEIAMNVPKYMLGEINLTAAYPKERIAFFKASADNTLFVYKYDWNGDQRVQSAWGKWTFGDSANVRHVDFVEGNGILLIEREGALHLETINIGDGLTDTGLGFQVMIDRRVRETGLSRVLLAGETTVTMPYDLDSALTAADHVVATIEGVELTINSIGTNTIVLDGDHASTEMWLGQRYTQSITLSDPIPQREGPTGPVPRSGHYTPHNLEIKTAGTGGFLVTITPAGMDESFSHEFEAAVTDPLETATVSNEAKIVGINSPAEGLVVVISNDSALPSRFTGLVWNGDLSPYRASL
jgi:hypothetical protein